MRLIPLSVWCRAAVAMFEERGMNSLVNDNLVDSVLSLGYLTVGLTGLLTSFAYSAWVRLNHADAALVATAGFFAGYMMCNVVMKLVSSAVATVFVCYGECPDTLQVGRVEGFGFLCRSLVGWRE